MQIQLKYLAEEMQAISKGLEKIVQELTASEGDGPVSETFCQVSQCLSFYEFCELPNNDCICLVYVIENVIRINGGEHKFLKRKTLSALTFHVFFSHVMLLFLRHAPTLLYKTYPTPIIRDCNKILRSHDLITEPYFYPHSFQAPVWKETVAIRGILIYSLYMFRF